MRDSGEGAEEAKSSIGVVAALPPPENNRFYPALDGLRAVAVMMVFGQHYLITNQPSLSWGWTGVDVFFVLSGFLITGILFDTRHDAHRVRNFYVRRTLRIFPLYYGVLVVAFLLTPVFHWLWSASWILWALYLGNFARFLFIHSPLFRMGATDQLLAFSHGRHTFTVLLGHFWSLCVEEQFYLVWPMVVFAVRRRETLLRVCVCAVPCALLARVACVLFAPKIYLTAGLLYSCTPLRVDALLIGGGVALCLRGPEAALVRRWARPVLLGGSVAFVVWLLAFRVITGRSYQPYTGAPVMDTIGYSCLDLWAAALLVECLDRTTPLARLLSRRWLRGIGQMSYGIYVFHEIPHMLYRAAVERVFGKDLAHGGTVLTFLLALAGTMTISTLSYRFYEAPLLRLKSRFTR